LFHDGRTDNAFEGGAYKNERKLHNRMSSSIGNEFPVKSLGIFKSCDSSTESKHLIDRKMEYKKF
jgi:hypothetical protein